MRWLDNAARTDHTNPFDHHRFIHSQRAREVTMDNPFTRTYELGKELGSKLQRLETVATLRKIIESADEHDREVLEAVLKAIEVKDE